MSRNADSPTPSHSLPEPPRGADDLDARSPADGDESVFDWEAALERMEGDATILGEAVDMFLAEAPRHLSDIHGAVARRDLKALALAAHSLKGMASLFDATFVVAETKRMELLAKDGDIGGARRALQDLEHELARLVVALQTVATT
jgi:HPt (histidine-containing phosphotransfer) domain-containing protein